MSELGREVHDAAWARWLAMYPEDADCDREQQAMLLDTLRGHQFVLRAHADAIAAPARDAAHAMLDQADARMRDLRDEAMHRLLRHWR